MVKCKNLDSYKDILLHIILKKQDKTQHNK